MRPVLRHLSAVEAIVAVAIVATVFAVAYREPLTRQTLELSPADEGKRFYGYTYDDRSNGGTSVGDYSAADPLAWTCTLRQAFNWPYCAFGITFEALGKGRGL